ncbi:hypothetical protein GOODEAATRI_008953 [Goodea atripinnis]|uniref:Agouti signaling protein n=1 Tax=Goodea atripinnis TaxID=208336 RepID=A0ABV0PWZ2_9TELE
MLVSAWSKCCIAMLVVASVRTEASQLSEARPKANSIKPSSLEETPTPAGNRSAPVTRKHRLLPQGTILA